MIVRLTAMTATLYYSPTSCGAANFIVAHKAGSIANGKVVAYEANIRNHTIVTGPKAGSDYYQVNPKGNVPTVVLDNGVLLNENVATLVYLADTNPDAKLIPPPNSVERYVVLSKLAFIATELHKGSFGPLFNPNLAEEGKKAVHAQLAKTLTYLNNVELAGDKKFLVGNTFTCADSYAYIVLGWAPYVGVDLSPYANVKKYWEGIKALDFVQEAHAAMAAASPKA
ncbi:hypothetical protein HDV03_001730 [Kappamyces sp. JEL0829]|nr:hypothetical protein HDV03_001730 [Kappamyces sp. JEL0829]